MESLLFDLGNSNLKLAYAQDSKIIKQVRVKTVSIFAESVVIQAIEDLLERPYGKSSHLPKPKSCFICSVVPKLNDLISLAIEKSLACPYFFVPQNLPLPLNFLYENQTKLGADRLIAAYAASELHQDFKVKYIIDIGTATTIDCVMDNTFMGGLILPGPNIALKGLHKKTAQLPFIKFPDTINEFSLGHSTVECMEQGIFFGTIAQIEGLLTRLKDLNPYPSIVIGTGGVAKILSAKTNIFDVLYDNLILLALAMLSQKQALKDISISDQL